MKPKVIVYKTFPQEVKEYIEQSCEVRYFDGQDSKSLINNLEFLQELQDTKGLIGSGLKVNEKLIEHAPQLKIVCNTSVGYDNLDIEALTNRNIMATNTPDVLNDTTADTIFGLLIATARRIPELDQLVKNGDWNKAINEKFFGVDVHHKVLGIIGMGRIGTAIAKRANLGFDMKILYHNRTRNEEAERNYDATYCELDELLKKSDYVCVMVPLTPETKNSFGEREFNLMKKSAILIIGSRGGIVNENALIKALEEKKILAAGLDVFEKEPIERSNPLLKYKNVVTLPHIGSATYETRFQMQKLAAENLVKGLTGQRPASLINTEVL